MASQPTSVFGAQSSKTSPLKVEPKMTERLPSSPFTKKDPQPIKVSTNLSTSFIFTQKATPTTPEIKIIGPKTVFKTVARRQIILTFDEVKSNYPNFLDTQIYSIIGLVRSTVLESIDQMSEFGLSLQKQLSTLLDKELNFIQGSSLEDAKTCINKIVSQLTDFDIESLSLKSRVLNLFINKHEQFKTNYSKLENTISELDLKVPSLKTTRSLIEKNANDSKIIEDNIQIYLVAAKYLLPHATKDVQSVLERRIIDLTMSQTTIVTNKLQRKMTIDAINTIIDNVNSVLSSELPLWKTGIITALNTKNSAGISQDLVNKRTEIIAKLN